MNQTIHSAHSAADDFFARLRKAQPTLPRKMARLADYVSTNYVKVAIMSTREVAEAAGVSLATVVRFPRVLRYSEFDALRSSIQDRVNFDLTGVERMKTVSASDRSASGLLSRIIERDCESLRALARTFVEADLERFSVRLAKAARVSVFGSRYVGPLADYFAYALGKIKPGVDSLTYVDSTAYDRIRMMDSSAHVIVAIAFPRYPADFMKVLSYASKRGIPILAITDSPLSPVISVAEVAMLAKASMLDFVGSLAAPAALINCVVADLGRRMGRPTLERLQMLEEAAVEGDTYVRSNHHAADGGWQELTHPTSRRRVRAGKRGRRT